VLEKFLEAIFKSLCSLAAPLSSITRKEIEHLQEVRVERRIVLEGIIKKGKREHRAFNCFTIHSTDRVLWTWYRPPGFQNHGEFNDYFLKNSVRVIS
jgi:hypothetical protein